MATNLSVKTSRLVVGLCIRTLTHHHSSPNIALWSRSLENICPLSRSPFLPPLRHFTTKFNMETDPKISVSPSCETVQIQTEKDVETTEESAVANVKDKTIAGEQDANTVLVTNDEKVVAPPEKKEYLRRRKMVLMLSYCGQEYSGMQRNPGTKTIEEDLLQALLKAGYIDEEASKLPRVMQFQRAARTDKHVSAARQIVSMKMPDKIDVSKINSFLPAEVRVMGVKKATKGFDCKTNCDGRTYMYMIPSFAFVPIDQSVTEDYRINEQVLTSLRTILETYVGTKNFHNFTSRRKPTDPSSKRYIISFTASEPFVKDGLEYVILRVKGQSFMLHQIRKMIGLVVAYMRGFAGKDTFEKAWESDRIDIPKVPGVGLVLDHVHYERYNQRYGTDGMHSLLTWDEFSDQVEEFCQTYIYPVITKSENEEKSMFEWLTTLPYHTYDMRETNRDPNIKSIDFEDGDDGRRPRELSKIGQAGLMANCGRMIPALADDEDEGEDSDGDDVGKSRKRDSSRSKKEKVKSDMNNDDDDDDDDTEFVQAELAKRKKTVS